MTYRFTKREQQHLKDIEFEKRFKRNRSIYSAIARIVIDMTATLEQYVENHDQVTINIDCVKYVSNALREGMHTSSVLAKFPHIPPGEYDYYTKLMAKYILNYAN